MTTIVDTIFACLGVALILGTTTAYTGPLSENVRDVNSKQDPSICQGKPADVVFLMDSSGSIYNPDFKRQLSFVQEMLDLFDVSPQMTRVGAVSFSNYAYLDFHLNTFQEKSDIRSYVGEIRQVRGDTNTAAALRYLRTISFTEANGARRGIPHIGIVLTDGRSNAPEETEKQALLARQQGIHLFALGIGNNVDEDELRNIASSPAEHYVHRVDSYSALASIKELLAIEACSVTEPPEELTTTLEPLPVDQACGEANIADIVFSLSPHASADNTEKALEFYKEVASGLEVDEDRVRVGLVPKDCSSFPEIPLEEYDQKEDMVDRLDHLGNGQSTFGTVLRYMRRVSFAPKNGARDHAKKIGLVIVDGPEANLKEVVREARKNKGVRNIEMFVIGVGKDVKPSQLEAIASEPAEQHIFHVSSYSELIEIAERVQRIICPVPSL